MKENHLGDFSTYNFKFTKTPPTPTREEFETQMAVIGAYYNYFSLSSAISWTKKSWVPFWLWKLVADGRFIGDEENAQGI